MTDRLVEANQQYAGAFTDPGMDARPVLHVAVVACMDARLDLHAALGLELGDCHTIRNAGGVVTDDVIRSSPSASGRSAPAASFSSTTPAAA